MYAVHTTPGFIIESRPNGEAGKILSIFTRDLGLVRAAAQGIRLEKSKLRYHSQEYSFGEYSFVRGKEFWRLTSAAGLKNDEKVDALLQNHEGDYHSADTDALIARIALLLRRLLHGEDAHPELFMEISSAVYFLQSIGQASGLSTGQLQAFESLLVFRIMRHLGYIGLDKMIKPELFDAPLSIMLIDTASAQRKALNEHINKALKQSHL